MSRQGKVAQYKRRSEVLTLFAAGRDPEDIVALINHKVAETGEGHKATIGAVKSIITRALERWASDVPPEEVERARRVALERLDQMTSALWTKVKAGDPRAIDTALRVEERRARIVGIEKPVTHEHHHLHEHELVDRGEIDRAERAFMAGADADSTATEITENDDMPLLDISTAIPSEPAGIVSREGDTATVEM